MAGSTLFSSSKATNHDIGGGAGHLVARAARFFKGFDVIAPENPKNFLVPTIHGQVLSCSGAKSLPRFLTLGVLNGGPKVYSSLERYWDWDRDRTVGTFAEVFSQLLRAHRNSRNSSVPSRQKMLARMNMHI